MKIPPVQYWRKIVSRGNYPIIFIWELNNGLKDFHKETGFKIKMRNYCRFGGASYIYEPEARKVTEEIRKIVQKNPQQALDWLKKYNQKEKELFSLINNFLRRKNFSFQSLEKFYKDYTSLTKVVWRWGYLPFLVDEILEDELNENLNKLGVPSNKIFEMTKILSWNSKLTLHQKEHVELLKLAKEIRLRGWKRYPNKIKLHLKKWCWKNSWIYNQVNLTQEELEKELMNILNKDPKALLSKFEKTRLKEKKEKEKLLANFKSSRLRVLSKLISEYTFWHSSKMERITMAIHLVKPLFRKLAAHWGISYQDFIELFPEEVLAGKINIKKIQERILGSGVLMLQGKTIILNHRQIKQLTKQMEENVTFTGEIKGFAVYFGKVSGRVVLVPSGKFNLSKFVLDKQSVLVTSMTSTNMTSLIKKAGAIVTDEGGLTCHAAIIAREMQKPCIIGTKNATKVLKDGDIVEVDANIGVVRKVSL